MKQILFATTNPSKVKRFREELLKKGIELISLKDLNIELNTLENGKDVIENAIIKAQACYKKIKMPVIGMDDSLYMENVPEDKQPGLYVRRVNGRNLTDDEMLDHYINLVNEYGINGRIDCKWIYGLAVINEYGEIKTYSWSKDNFYMVNKQSSKMNPGYPLNSISKYKGIDQYFTDITEEDKKLIKVNENDVVDFIIKVKPPLYIENK